MTFLFWLNWAGISFFAATGALSASRKQLDIIGFMFLGTIAGIGGGTLRDLLLNRHPIFWIRDARYLVVILAAALLSMLWSAWLPPLGHALLVADALGLALFAISGAQVAEADGHSPIVVVLMGTMTGAAGGMLRDMMSAQVPLIFRQDIYASAAIAGIAAYLLLKAAGLRPSWAIAAGVLVILGLRMGAVLWGWHLPRLHPAG